MVKWVRMVKFDCWSLFQVRERDPEAQVLRRVGFNWVTPRPRKALLGGIPGVAFGKTGRFGSHWPRFPGKKTVESGESDSTGYPPATTPELFIPVSRMMISPQLCIEYVVNLYLTYSENCIFNT